MQWDNSNKSVPVNHFPSLGNTGEELKKPFQELNSKPNTFQYANSEEEVGDILRRGTAFNPSVEQHMQWGQPQTPIYSNGFNPNAFVQPNLFNEAKRSFAMPSPELLGFIKSLSSGDADLNDIDENLREPIQKLGARLGSVHYVKSEEEVGDILRKATAYRPNNGSSFCYWNLDLYNFSKDQSPIRPPFTSKPQLKSVKIKAPQTGEIKKPLGYEEKPLSAKELLPQCWDLSQLGHFDVDRGHIQQDHSTSQQDLKNSSFNASLLKEDELMVAKVQIALYNSLNDTQKIKYLFNTNFIDSDTYFRVAQNLLILRKAKKGVYKTSNIASNSYEVLADVGTVLKVHADNSLELWYKKDRAYPPIIEAYALANNMEISQAFEKAVAELGLNDKRHKVPAVALYKPVKIGDQGGMPISYKDHPIQVRALKPSKTNSIKIDDEDVLFTFFGDDQQRPKFDAQFFYKFRSKHGQISQRVEQYSQRDVGDFAVPTQLFQSTSGTYINLPFELAKNTPVFNSKIIEEYKQKPIVFSTDFFLLSPLKGHYDKLLDYKNFIDPKTFLEAHEEEQEYKFISTGFVGDLAEADLSCLYERELYCYFDKNEKNSLAQAQVLIDNLENFQSLKFTISRENPVQRSMPLENFYNYCLKHELDIVRPVESVEVQRPEDVISIDDLNLDNDAIDEKVIPTDLVEDVMGLGEMILVVASKKNGKSEFSLGLAEAISKGVDYVGMKTKRSKVLYFDTEMKTKNYLKRGYKKSSYFHPLLVKEKLSRSFINQFSSYRQACFSVIEERVEKHKYSCVVIDCVYKLIDDNDGSSVKRLIEFCESLCAKNILVILVHHTNKKSNVAGHSDLVRSVDGTLTITRSKKKISFPDNTLREQTIIEREMREELEGLEVYLDKESHRFKLWTDPVQEKKEGTKASSKPTKILLKDRALELTLANLPKNEKEAWTRSKLIDFLHNNKCGSKSSFAKLLSEWTKAKFIKHKRAKESLYWQGK